MSEHQPIHDKEHLPPIYRVAQHESGWWGIYDSLQDCFLDGYYFRKNANAVIECMALNSKFDSDYDPKQEPKRKQGKEQG